MSAVASAVSVTQTFRAPLSTGSLVLNADDDQRDLYTVNADGSGLFQVTHTPDISEFNGDWGTHPLTP